MKILPKAKQMVFIIKRGNQEIGSGFIIRLISFPTCLHCSNSTATHKAKNSSKGD